MAIAATWSDLCQTEPHARGGSAKGKSLTATKMPRKQDDVERAMSFVRWLSFTHGTNSDGRRQEPPHPVRRTAGQAALTISTEHAAWRATASETPPSKNRSRPVRP